MKIQTIFLSTLIILLNPLTSKAQWSHEPPGSVLKAECNFNSSTKCVGGLTNGGTFYDLYNNMPIVNDSSAPGSGPGVVDAALIYPNTQGGGQLGWYNNAPTRDIYFGAYFKINAGYSCSSVGMSKFFFLRTYENTFGAPITNGVFLLGGCGDTKYTIFSHNTGGLKNQHTCPSDPYDGLTCYANVGPGTFQRGQWVKFEACVSASTTTTSRDGVVRWWVDGVEAGKYLDMNYGSMVVNEWIWNETWDGYGNGKGFTGDAHQYLDHLHISIPPAGGCRALGSGSGPLPQPSPAPAMSKPTNLRFI